MSKKEQRRSFIEDEKFSGFYGVFIISKEIESFSELFSRPLN